MAGAAINAKADDSDAPEQYGNFKRSVALVDLQGSYNQPIKVIKYTSDKTGLKVVLIDLEGPLCNLYAAVGTEIFSDAGSPHTLEHLVFMGSEKWPYKGVLNLLANRANAEGVNAWTDTTNTTYTLSTAGSDGFLRMLPIYVDHILYPSITEAAYTTEIHHINGDGEDAGVVYSEMQGKENLVDSVMFLAMQRNLYPEESGYRSQTGGLLDALRKLTVDEIRQYHKAYYKPQNLCLFVTGKVELEKLLKTLQEEVEPSIEMHGQAHGPRPDGWKRPFVETASARPLRLDEDRSAVVEFPEADESTGQVMMAWAGPAFNEFLTRQAINILNSYLTTSAVSPLRKDIVEIDDPYATDLWFEVLDQTTCVPYLTLSGVPAAKLEEAGPKVKAILRDVIESGIDMQQLQSVLQRERRKLLDTIENDAAELLATILLYDFLFDKEDSSELPASLGAIKRLEELEGWTAQQWADLLRRFYVDASSLTVIGRPSISLAEKLAKENAARVASTRASFGPDGLKKKDEKLQLAQKENDKEIPPQILSGFEVPDVASIRWIDVKTASGGINKAHFQSDVQKHVKADKAEVPYYLEFQHIESNFIEVAMYFNAADLHANRALLSLYQNSFASLPIIRDDGSRLSFEQVVQQLDAETVAYNANFGSGLSEQIEFSIKVEKGKYEFAIQWLRDLLFGSDFDVGRLRIIASKLNTDLASDKRDGDGVSTAVYLDMIYDATRSSTSAVNMLTRLNTAPKLVQRLQSEPEKVVHEMQTLRKALTSPRNMRVAISGNILDIAMPLSAWRSHFSHSFAEKHLGHVYGENLLPVTYSHDVLSKLGRAPSYKAIVVPLPSIESSFSYHVGKGPNRWNHPDLPAVKVALSAVNAIEGLLWNSVRGAGLAYGAGIVLDVEAGLACFRVIRSPDCAAAFAKARESMQAMVDGSYMPLDDLKIEGDKSSLAFATANEVATMLKAAKTAFVNHALMGVPQSYQRDLLEKAERVTVAEVIAATKKWLMPIFDSKTSIAAIAAGSSKSDDIKRQLTDLGYKVEILEITKPGGE